MCGIAGFIDNKLTSNKDVLHASVKSMIKPILHRGPDDCGIWQDAKSGIALGHRRLSIQDLSIEGHQPMISPCGRFVLVYNGEIYNHLELREELEREGGHFDWRGHSDTETLLASLRHWGVEATLQRLNGMFAFAMWDRAENTLYLARDRMGEKPLYYGWIGGAFIFGSELKALTAYPHWNGEIDRDALTLLLRHNCIPAPYSIYKNVSKLRPGHLLSLPVTGQSMAARVESRAFWSLPDVIAAGKRDRFSGSEVEAVDELDRLLRHSVAQQMISDVPLGAFLSGGIDSSTVVGIMQALSDRPIRTFSIGIGEKGYNEAEDAKAVARYLGTEHTELYVSPEQAMEAIPLLPSLYDEPFSDSSQIPTFLVSQLARKQVTVTLSGDGGDELFGGYNRHFWVPNVWRHVGHWPMFLRKIVVAMIQGVPPQRWDSLFASVSSILPRRLRYQAPGDRIHKFAAVLSADSMEAIYRQLVSHWQVPQDIVLGATEPATLISSVQNGSVAGSFTEQMMYLDAVTYLPDDILVKVDRASMGVSLETRVPLLNHKLVEFAWRLPLEMKVRNGQGKWILRQVLDRYVPRSLVDKPKSGFSIPLDHWLRGSLRDWAEALLDEERLRREGILNPGPIRQKWNEHLSGRRNWQHDLWDVLMFQAWLEAQG